MTNDAYAEIPPGFSPPVGHTTLGVIAVWGLVINAVYQVITAIGIGLVIALIGTGIGAFVMTNSTNSSDQMAIVIGVIVGVAVPILSLSIPLLSAASALYASIGVYRGGHTIRLYAGIAGSVVGPSAMVMMSVLGLVFLGILGFLAAVVTTSMMVVTVVIAALAVAVVSRETALLREEGAAAYASSLV